MSPFPNHNYGAGNTAHHFGQMYSQQRSSFAIQELLGLNSCRQNGSSPDLMDSSGVVPGSLPGMYHLPNLGTSNASMPGSHRVPGVDAQPPSFLREQPMATAAGGGSFCPWRFDPLTSQPHVPQGMAPAAPRFSGVGRHGDDLNFGFKHNIADDGECAFFFFAFRERSWWAVVLFCIVFCFSPFFFFSVFFSTFDGFIIGV